VVWAQNDFTGSGLAPAEVEVFKDRQWELRALLPGPLSSGTNGIIGLDVSDLEGFVPVRVVVDGALNSPLTLGTLRLDRTAPRALDPLVATDRTTVTAGFTQDDGGLSGTDPTKPTVVEVNSSPAGDGSGEWMPFTEQPAPGDGPRVARTWAMALAEGRHLVRVRSQDVAGNVAVQVIGEAAVSRSAATSIEPQPFISPAPQPLAATPAAAQTSSGPTEVVTEPRALSLERSTPPGGVRWAWSALRRMHAARGVALEARLSVAASEAEWRREVGPAARQLVGYASLGGDVLLSPRTAADLTVLARLRARGAVIPRAPRTPVARRLVESLAVTLHESIHASGASVRDDVRTTRSGRALEEGITEALTVDLLPTAIRALRLPTASDRALRAAARTYRPAYPAQVTWVRTLTARATGTRPGSDAATRLRAELADRLTGGERWVRLSALLDIGEDALRAGAPALAPV
jgi:hypothetical protein